MIVRTIADAVAYRPPGHVGVESARLQGVEAGGPAGYWVARSLYPPGSGAELAPVAGDTVYVVLEGCLDVTAGGVVHSLHRHDSAFIAAGEERSVLNASGEDAVLLVVLQPTGG